MCGVVGSLEAIRFRIISVKGVRANRCIGGFRIKRDAMVSSFVNIHVKIT